MSGSNDEAFPQFRVDVCGPFQVERRAGVKLYRKKGDLLQISDQSGT